MRPAALLILAAVAIAMAAILLLAPRSEIDDDRPEATNTKSAPLSPTRHGSASSQPLGPPPPPPPPKLSGLPSPPLPPDLPPLPSEVVAQAKTDFREMVAAKTRADLSTAGFFQKLSPQQQGKLVDVITKNETDLMQRLTEAAEKGKVLSEGDFAALRGDGEQSIKSMLSASEYSDYQQHALSAPDRNILAQTSQVLGRSLSEESSEGLLSLLAQERQNMLSNPPQNGQELTQAVAGMAERVNARAATVLTSDQERQALQQVLSGLVEGASKKPPGR